MLDELLLRKLYIDEQRSMQDIATQTSLSVAKVRQALIQYHIPRRPSGFPQTPTTTGEPTRVTLEKVYLERLYLEEGRSIDQIAQLTGWSTRTVYNALLRHRIPRRPRSGRNIPKNVSLDVRRLEKATMHRLYVQEGQTITAIAKAMHCSVSSVRSALIRMNIPRRRPGRRQQR